MRIEQWALAQGAAVLCAGAAIWWGAERERGLRRARVVLAGVGALGPPGAPGRARPSWRAVGERWWGALRGRRAWLCLPVAAVIAVLGQSPLPLAAGAIAVPLAGRRLRAVAHRKEREARSDAVVALCGAVAAELRAGRQPARALLFAVGATGALGPKEEAEVVAAARFGGDVAQALRSAARREGADGLAGLAACWQVAVDGGAGLAAGLDRLEAALRDHRDQRERLRAQLAGAWATVAVLAVLPAVGLALGTALGARPLHVLLHAPVGLACLAVGSALEVAGLWWAARIVRGGERV
ncbi:type II secretion system F family protein [Streptomyces sp. Je 1-79]|uniref:type II secretion system F family protein n=1 Tax=Streptomyces sp. Je 1-79 TaxID=2943847 RepID=UPI0021A673B4|nr:type II secretion system F family protein [Streptomyces sp. Je 1-79]MCT4354620.1 type II secretion system F family protein [Streptomyces sp. Je 1-79]